MLAEPESQSLLQHVAHERHARAGFGEAAHASEVEHARHPEDRRDHHPQQVGLEGVGSTLNMNASSVSWSNIAYDADMEY